MLHFQVLAHIQSESQKVTKMFLIELLSSASLYFFYGDLTVKYIYGTPTGMKHWRHYVYCGRREISMKGFAS